MQFEVIRKSHNKKVVIGVVAIILIAVVLLVRNSFAKYQITKNLKIAEGTINYTVPDFKIMGICYQKEGQTCTEDSCYEEKESMPESGYKINITKSYCELNGSKDNNAEMYTDENGQHVIAKLTKGDRCYLYFDKVKVGSDQILGNVTVNESPDSFTGPATGNEGVFKTEDDDGDTYYWRGAVENNYVNFAGFYWRIIRINGDGTIRLIYQGTKETSTGTDAQIGTSTFNSSYSDNKYVGFKYSSNDAHGTGTESTILGTLNTWYETNIDEKGYSGKVDQNAGFCNDRDPYTDKSGTTPGGGTGTTTTYYGAYIRILPGGSWGATKIPTFKCKDSRDLFTKSGAVKKDGTTANGNRSLKYPIGLITADEVVYAGGFGGKANSSYYLYTGQVYWTLSPYMYGYAIVFIVDSDGGLNASLVNYVNGVRPVINLESDTKFTYKDATTKGTMDDPYVVE